VLRVPARHACAPCLLLQGIDGLLHEWQLKFMMIGWSGGFLSEPIEQSFAKEEVGVKTGTMAEGEVNEMEGGDQDVVAFVVKVCRNQFNFYLPL